MSRAHAQRSFRQPPAAVFARYTDHASWTEWAGFGRVTLARAGTDVPNGVGAVRAFAAAPKLREEVTRFEPPYRMEYRVTAGAFPLADHHGEVVFTPEGTGTRVRWDVTFRSRVPGLGLPIARALGVVFGRVLAGLARDLDAHGALRREARSRIFPPRS